MKLHMWRMLWKEVTASAKALRLEGSQCVEGARRPAQLAENEAGRVPRDKVRERERQTFGVNDLAEDIEQRRTVTAGEEC